jgi:hypothetical protein
MYNLENLSGEIKRYRAAKVAYLNADVSVIGSEQVDCLRRQYDDAAHSVAFHAEIVVDSLVPNLATAFQIPTPDAAPNLASMFDEPELLIGFADCRDCGSTKTLDGQGRCASCAIVHETGAAPAYLTNQDAFEAVMNAEWANRATITDLDPQPGSSSDDIDLSWIEPATEEQLSIVMDSRDYPGFDDWDGDWGDDDEWNDGIGFYWPDEAIDYDEEECPVDDEDLTADNTPANDEDIPW